MKISEKERLSDGVEIVIARTLGEIERIRSIWEEMQKDAPYPVINADIDRYLSVVEANAGNLRPYVILIKQHGQPMAMAIGRLEQHPIEVKLGYKVLLSPKLRCLTIVYGGILGQPGKDVCSVLIGELMKVLRRGKVDVVYFNHLRTDSCIYQVSRKLPGILNRGRFPKVENHWSMSVPGDIDLFYQARSKKHRGNIRRSIKKLETEYTDRVEVVYCKGQDGLDAAIKAVHQVSLTTYQHGLGCGFVDDSRTRGLLTTAGKQFWHRFAVMFIDGQPSAFQIGLRYQGTYFLQQIGFNSRWTDFNVGTILFVKVLEHICADPGIQYIDFGFGDADYKRSYADMQWQEASVYIFAPRPYPIALNILQAAVAALSLGLNRLSDKVGLIGWLKRRWRNSLQGGRNTEHKTGVKKS